MVDVQVLGFPRSFAVCAASLLLLLAVGCGSSDSGGTNLRGELVGTEWRVVSMTGFPDDNVAQGTFDFTPDRFRFSDGVNWASNRIRWNGDGFAVEAGGDSTAAGYHDGPKSYFNTFSKVGATVTVVFNPDGSLTMSRDDLVVVGVPAE
jgi:hypothetical protein